MRVWQKVTKQGRLRSETGECLPGQWLLQAEEHRKPHWPTLVGRGREMCQRGPGCGWSALLVWWLRNSSSSSLGLLWAEEKVYGPHRITEKYSWIATYWRPGSSHCAASALYRKKSLSLPFLFCPYLSSAITSLLTTCWQWLCVRKDWQKSKFLSKFNI